MVAARMFTLSRLPDYNDLFNIGAIVVCFDMASVSALLCFAIELTWEGNM